MIIMSLNSTTPNCRSEHEIDFGKSDLRAASKSIILEWLTDDPIRKRRIEILEELQRIQTKKQKRVSPPSATGLRIKKKRIDKNGDLFVLDFDGLLCDSTYALTSAAIEAAKLRWPSLFKDPGDDDGAELWFIDLITHYEPKVEAAYDYVLLVRLLLESEMHSIHRSLVAEGLGIGEILKNWPKLKPVIMEEWVEDRETLAEFYVNVRDEEMEKSCWVEADRFHEGIDDALRSASARSKIYIVTTLKPVFAALLLHELLLPELSGVIVPLERIIRIDSGGQDLALKMIQKLPENQGFTLHFIDAQLSALKAVLMDPGLDEWYLYLGNWPDWGSSSTGKERKEADDMQNCNLIDMAELSIMLKHGAFW